MTDGSKLNLKVGGAFVITKNKNILDHKTYRISDTASVYMAELVAINK